MKPGVDEPKAIILMYHRVSDVEADPFSLSVAPRHFAEHLQILRQRAQPMRLRQLAGALRNGSIPPRSVVLTFDDGYADNLHNAKPLLEHYDVPATVFITTGFVGQNREFWWDELERIFLEPGLLPKSLSLTIHGCNHRWELGASSSYSEDECRRHRRWRAGEEPPTSRHSAYLSIWPLLQLLPDTERRAVLDEIAAWAGNSTARAAYRGLSVQELRGLQQKTLIEIGAHTVTHPAMPELPADEQRSEVRQSKRNLEEILGHPVASFAYPYGAKSEEGVAIVREAGFQCACATTAGCAAPGSDVFQLPRVQADDWGGEDFAERLAAWFDAASDSPIWHLPETCHAAGQALVRGKWLFRAVGGNQARLVFSADDPDGVRIEIARAATQTSFDIQLNQPNIAVQAERRYAVSFRARADGRRTISVGFAQAHEPWNGLGLYETIDLTPEWKSCDLSFVAVADESYGRIHFDAGANDISVELRDVCFCVLPEDDRVAAEARLGTSR